MTIVSHDFKESRFIKIHCKAIRWPEYSRTLTYVGIDPPEEVTSRAELDDGEAKRGYGLWKEDWYGVGVVLAKKRRDRGWVEGRERELADGLEVGVRGLLAWKGGDTGVEVFNGDVPWDQ